MFIRGNYDDVYVLNQLFGQRFILIDGEQFKLGGSKQNLTVAFSGLFLNISDNEDCEIQWK